MKHYQSGVSMLEILIALLITTIGLLGFASLQSKALLSTEDTYQRTQATSLAQDMLERMRMNGMKVDKQSNAASTSSSAYLNAGNWTGSAPVADCFGMTKNCSTDQMALYDIAQIRAAVESSGNLPNGSAAVASCADNRVCSYVAWGDDTATACAAANGIGMKTCVVMQGN